MSEINTALLVKLPNGPRGFSINDELVAGPATAQATATPLRSHVNRCTSSVASGNFVLPSILSEEATSVIWLINDSAQTVLVGAFGAESVNGVATTTNFSAGTLSIAAGATGVFVPVPAYDRQGSVISASPDWRAAAIT